MTETLDKSKLVFLATVKDAKFSGNVLDIVFTNGRAVITEAVLQDKKSKRGLFETLAELEQRGVMVEQVRDQDMPADAKEIIHTVVPVDVAPAENPGDEYTPDLPTYIPAIVEAEKREEEETKANRAAKRATKR